MIAIKDSYAEDWCFSSLKKYDSLSDKLFSKELSDKLATNK